LPVATSSPQSAHRSPG